MPLMFRHNSDDKENMHSRADMEADIMAKITAFASNVSMVGVR